MGGDVTARPETLLHTLCSLLSEAKGGSEGVKAAAPRGPGQVQSSCPQRRSLLHLPNHLGMFPGRPCATATGLSRSQISESQVPPFSVAARPLHFTFELVASSMLSPLPFQSRCPAHTEQLGAGRLAGTRALRIPEALAVRLGCSSSRQVCWCLLALCPPTGTH